mmetsp:Transcript_13194/g.21422  ORF Transcript_13194/g.21422 Transcript_13194/m.21422 type:complete len:276 (-) Transcript_13194:1233-2060(-)
MLPTHGGGGGGQAHGRGSSVMSSMSRRSNATFYGDHYGSSHKGQSLFKYLRRVVYYPQMDFQYTFSQMGYLLKSPSKVYKLTSWRNQTKNQWARDDPAFVVIVCLLILLVSVLYGIALGKASFPLLLGLVAINIGLFLGCGVLLATFGWWVSNTYFRARHSHSVEQEVEWLYAFDIHCNAYFPMFMLLYVLQFFMLPLLLSSSFAASFVADTLYVIAFSYYHYVSFLGYMYLPFLNKERVTSMLYPIAVLVVTYALFVVLNINACRFTLSFFFNL